jgi:hypothetical protein
LKAQPWFQVQDKSFWVLITLPFAWFILAYGLLIVTVVFRVFLWERPFVHQEIPKKNVIALSRYDGI